MLLFCSLSYKKLYSREKSKKVSGNVQLVKFCNDCKIDLVLCDFIFVGLIFLKIVCPNFGAQQIFTAASKNCTESKITDSNFSLDTFSESWNRP